MLIGRLLEAEAEANILNRELARGKPLEQAPLPRAIK
jgi:hypothetical protein